MKPSATALPSARFTRTATPCAGRARCRCSQREPVEQPQRQECGPGLLLDGDGGVVSDPDSPAYRIVHDWNRQLREDETVSIRVERAAATARIGLAAPRRRAQ